MDNNQFTPEVEPQVTPVVEEPRGKAIVSMVFGIISVAGCSTSIIALVFAILAMKFAKPILIGFPGTASARFAKVGKITGTIGLILSIVVTVVYILAVVLGVLIGLAAVLGGAVA